MLVFKISNHLKNLAEESIAIRKQFIPSSKEDYGCEYTVDDPLLEEAYSPTRGLVHKYANRVLILLTFQCESYCRFCTRRRTVSDIKRGQLTDSDIGNMRSYIKAHPEIKEVIFSGGDPLTVPPLLDKAMKQITSLPQIKIVRIGTRLPVSNPQKINQKILNILKQVKQPLYILIHFEHPDEITQETIGACADLRKIGSMLFSQSVFLKGVNDNYKTLYDLFTRLVEIGVKPYYVYHCDPTIGVGHFIVDFAREVEIMTKLRKNLSGLAFPVHVVDVPGGSGKVPAPLNFWQHGDINKCSDFLDNKKKII